MNMPFPDDAFDAVYAIEATCDAPDAVRMTRPRSTCVVEINQHYCPELTNSLWAFLFFFPWRVHVHGMQLACYSEICRVLKPGQHFALFEWCVTDRYDPDNESHRSIKAEIESSDGLPEIRSTRQCIQALKGAGFEVGIVRFISTVDDSALQFTGNYTGAILDQCTVSNYPPKSKLMLSFTSHNES